MSERGTSKDEMGTLYKHLILEISRDYGVLLEDAGHTLRGLFIIDPKGIIRQITINDLPVGRYVFNTFTFAKLI